MLEAQIRALPQVSFNKGKIPETWLMRAGKSDPYHSYQWVQRDIDKKCFERLLKFLNKNGVYPTEYKNDSGYGCYITTGEMGLVLSLLTKKRHFQPNIDSRK